MLKRRYGNLARAWRLALDLDASGKLTFPEFGPALRQLGYEGSIRALWMELDHDCSGVICLKEIAPKLHELLDRFLQFLLNQFDTCEEAWRSLAPRGQMVLDVKDFINACTYLGWMEESKLIHRALDSTDRMVGNIKFNDLEWLGMPSLSAKEKNTLHRQKQLRRIVEDVEARKAPKDLPQFRAMLKRKFGNYLRAWRLALDTDCNSRISFHAFGVAVRRLSFDGSIKALWNELNVDGGLTISLVELDMPSAVKLERFKVWMRQQFETSEDAWEAIAHPGQTQVTEDRFVEALTAMGWVEDRLTLHRMLDMTCPPAKIIMQEDIDFVGIFDTGVDGDRLLDVGLDMFSFQTLALSPATAASSPQSPGTSRKRI